MQIGEVRVIPLYGAPLEGDWPERLSGDESRHTLIEVITDEGVTGVGSVYTSATLVSAAVDLVSPLLIGASPLGPSVITERMHQNTFWQGRGGAVTHAISGIDIALWDLYGKILGQSIGRLLGGRHRERIKPYGSMLMAEPAAMKDRLQEGISRGFRAFKIGWGPFGHSDHAHDEAIVAAARRAVGDEVELMVDAGASDAFWPHGYKWALRTAAMVADYGAAWFEEPLRPDDVDAYVMLTEHSPLPIAGGEVLTRRQSFLEWIERRAVDYLQPDVTKVGGISEQHRIGHSADDHGILCVPHGWNTAIGLAADLQLSAAAGNARWVEYMTPAPYIESLMAEPVVLDEAGLIAIPDAPGLGFRWDHDGVARLSRGITLTPSAV